MGTTIKCNGCGTEWNGDFDPPSCVCSDPNDPHYQAWVYVTSERKVNRG